MNEHEVLDFPGADGLISAGEVTAPGADVVGAALAAVRLAAAADGAAGVATGAAARGAVGDEVHDASDRPRRRFGRFGRRRILASPAAVAAVAAQTAAGAPYWKVRKTMHGRGGDTTGTYRFSRNGMIDRAPSGEYRWWPVGRDPGEQMAWQVAGRQVRWDDLPKLPTDPRALKAYFFSSNPNTPREEAIFNGTATLSRPR